MSPRFLTIGILALASPIAALAETSEPNLLSPQGSVPGGARIFIMAQELYALGLSEKDPLTLLTAARLAASVHLQEGGELKKETSGTVSENSDDPATQPVGPNEMLAAAKEFSEGDDLLLSLIEDAEVEGARGRVGGAIQRLSLLPGGLTDVWEVPFYGSSQSEVAIIGDGDSNLDFLIKDAVGNTICFDVSASDKMMCDFIPAENGYFYVTVQNKGDKKNSYYLLTN